MLRRRLPAFLLLLSLFWQALACASTGAILGNEAEQKHALMHMTGEAHHHDQHEGHGDAEGIHVDDSQASTQHMMDDACAHAPALLTFTELPVPLLRPEPPAQAALHRAVTPFLDGLERPPRLTD
jgi:hypothetical protein